MKKLTTYDYNKIKAEIEQYNYISFDVLNTLIKENVEQSNDLFQIIEEKYHVKDFKNIREKAETKARNKSDRYEPTLDEIYDEMNLNHKEKIKKAEIDLELKLCQQNIDFYPIYQFAEQHGKKIIIITDIHLEKNLIKKLLSNAKIKYDHLFVLNEIERAKCNKTFYDCIIQELKIDPQKILHISASKRTSRLIPKFHDIKSISIPRKINKLRYFANYHPQTLDEKIVINFVNNNIPPPNGNIYYDIGYEILGILLLAFTKWLQKELDEHKINEIFFLSREGALFKSAFDLLNNKKTFNSHYLYVSRRSTRTYALRSVDSIDELFDICNMRRVSSVKDFFQNIGLDIKNYKHLLDKLKIPAKANIKNINVEALFDSLKNDIQKNASHELKELISYLNHEKFTGNIAICDIGWYGSMQKALTEITEKTRIHGFYLYCNNKEMSTSSYLREKSFSDIRPYYIFLESFFLANHGTTLRYKQNRPIIDEYEYSKREQSIYQSIQTAALTFIKDFEKISSLVSSLNPNFTSYGIIRLAARPTLNDVELFGDIKYLDTYKNYMAKPCPLHNYLFNPKLLYQDYCKSSWKIGFLKRLLKLPFNYYLLLKLIYQHEK